MTPQVLWFRRDLRLADHPALLRAAERGPVVPLFVVDPGLWDPPTRPRVAYLRNSLAALAADVADRGGRLVVRSGDPAEHVLAVTREAGTDAVHVSAETTPYGRRRDEAVRSALAAAGVELVATGSPYAIGPGVLRNGSGQHFKVFSPYHRAWLAHGWAGPAELPDGLAWHDADGDDVPAEPSSIDGIELPTAGEAAARTAWSSFLDGPLAGYATARNRPDDERVSRLSVRLKYGELHPRTLLADLAELEHRDPSRERSVDAFRRQLCWREFYADMVANVPSSAYADLRADMRGMRYDTGRGADERFAAWAEGRTGYPIVDAGMRQLATEAYVHNRVRLIVSSFLTKDLHLPWQRGARLFADRLLDYDVASNNHGWQWVAGTGSDPAPYFRILNPTRQGTEFDPNGDYVRRYVPELREVAGGAVHEPWKLPGGLPDGYPERIVDHAEERKDALDRYANR